MEFYINRARFVFLRGAVNSNVDSDYFTRIDVVGEQIEYLELQIFANFRYIAIAAHDAVANKCKLFLAARLQFCRVLYVKGDTFCLNIVVVQKPNLGKVMQINRHHMSEYVRTSAKNKCGSSSMRLVCSSSI